LIEVIIAMGILVGTTAVLVQLIRIGERQANRAVDMTEAQTLCHNKMTELMAGLTALVPIQNEPIAVDSPWDYSVQIEPLGFRELFALTVIISEHRIASGSLPEDLNSNPRRFHLTRWVNASELPADIQLDFNDSQQPEGTEASDRTFTNSIRNQNSGPQ
jgi:hypothetical protein